MSVSQPEKRITMESIDADSAIVHVDLSDADSKRKAQERLEGVTRYGEALSTRNPDFEHLIVLLNGCPLPEEEALSIAERFALSLHQHLQTARGTYVAVTALVNSPDGPPVAPAALRERIVTFANAQIGLDPAIAYSVREIADEDIDDLATNEIV